MKEDHKILRSFLNREKYAIGDILTAVGDTSNKSRSTINNLISYANQLEDKSVARGKRYFTGSQVLTYAVIYRMYDAGVISASMIESVFDGIVGKRFSPNGVEICRQSKLDEMEAAKEALVFEHPISRVWLAKDHTLLMGIYLTNKLGYWVVGGAMYGAMSTESPLVHFITVDLNSALMPIVDRLKNEVPRIPINNHRLEIRSVKKSQQTPESGLRIKGAEKCIIEIIRNQIARNRGGLTLDVKTNFEGEIKSVSYTEKGISPKQNAKKLFDDSDTMEVRSIKGSDGKIASFERKVRIEF